MHLARLVSVKYIRRDGLHGSTGNRLCWHVTSRSGVRHVLLCFFISVAVLVNVVVGNYIHKGEVQRDGGYVVVLIRNHTMSSNYQDNHQECAGQDRNDKKGSDCKDGHNRFCFQLRASLHRVMSPGTDDQDPDVSY